MARKSVKFIAPSEDRPQPVRVRLQRIRSFRCKAKETDMSKKTADERMTVEQWLAIRKEASTPISRRNPTGRAVERPPSGDAALQGQTHPQGDPGISTANLLEDGHRADAWGGLQHRHDLAIPHPGKRVGTAASTRPLFLGRHATDRLRSDRRWRC